MRWISTNCKNHSGLATLTDLHFRALYQQLWLRLRGMRSWQKGLLMSGSLKAKI